jgi:hypothetical protein
VSARLVQQRDEVEAFHQVAALQVLGVAVLIASALRFQKRLDWKMRDFAHCVRNIAQKLVNFLNTGKPLRRGPDWYRLRSQRHICCLPIIVYLNWELSLLRLQGFDLELRIITQRNGRLFTQSREFTHSDALYIAKFNKLTVEPRGSMLAEVISAERRSKIIQQHG